MRNNYIFEWSAAKNASNIKKHGVSFEQAESIWDDPFYVEVFLTSYPEDRWAVIGRIAKQIYLTAIVTYRERGIRIISARRATKKEIDAYGNG